MSTTIVERAVGELRHYAKNPRVHKPKQIRQIALSIKHFGFTNPVLVSDDLEIIAGHGRVEAAKLLGMKTVPTIALSGMSAADRKAYVIADNKLAIEAGWDIELLAGEFDALVELGFDLTLTGFSLAEIDFSVDNANEANPKTRDAPEERIPNVPAVPTTVSGDMWLLGRHRLFCGDAEVSESYQALLRGELADLVFTDPPYNVPIDGHVSGLGKVKHREFARASGEMSDDEFERFLKTTLSLCADNMRDGAIAFVCMDWRGADKLLAAGKAAFEEMKNLIVFKKKSGGMGTCYRSQHELIFMYKHGTAPHTNTFGLGDTGRYRTNVWEYSGGSNFSASRGKELAMHPTVKPVALVADALKDCSKRGEIILDVFGGSGSTLIAAEKTGRSARLIEIDERYCDVIVTRWEELTGKSATLVRGGRTIDLSNESVSDEGTSS